MYPPEGAYDTVAEFIAMCAGCADRRSFDVSEESAAEMFTADDVTTRDKAEISTGTRKRSLGTTTEMIVEREIYANARRPRSVGTSPEKRYYITTVRYNRTRHT